MSNFRETCPQCEQPISVEKGKVTTCLVCNASQVHSDPGPGEIWRRCPVCHIFFQAAPLKSLSCPYCLGNRNLPTNDGFDKWVPDAAFPQVHTNRSQSGTLPESTHNTRRPVLQLFLALWQPYHAAIERFLVKIWPTSLFTFTEEERRALR
ncbi:MAG: hypothetical protein MPJ25_13285, partial [Pirellulales bacterium]|nr:hypothetical protein [Pirellulales bacterium]